MHDAGTVLNQALLDGQVHGALAQALGGALFEEMRYADTGQPSSATFMDYLCPTSAEACFPLVAEHLVTPSPFTALGAKGSGEGLVDELPGRAGQRCRGRAGAGRRRASTGCRCTATCSTRC